MASASVPQSLKNQALDFRSCLEGQHFVFLSGCPVPLGQPPRPVTLASFMPQTPFCDRPSPVRQALPSVGTSFQAASSNNVASDFPTVAHNPTSEHWNCSALSQATIWCLPCFPGSRLLTTCLQLATCPLLDRQLHERRTRIKDSIALCITELCLGKSSLGF